MQTNITIRKSKLSGLQKCATVDIFNIVNKIQSFRQTMKGRKQFS